MNMVTETKHLDYGDKLVDFYNSIDWGWLFDFVREKYGVGMVQHPEAKMNKNGRIEVSWPENLKDKCGLLGKAYREVYLRTFSSLNFHDVTYDKDIHEAAGFLQTQPVLCRLEWNLLGCVLAD